MDDLARYFGLAFTRPEFLALLATVPLVVLLSFRSLAGLGRTRRILAVAIRCLVIAALVVALAGPERLKTVDDQTVVFAVDRSDSIPDGKLREALAYMRAAAEHMRTEKDRVAVLAFDGRPAAEQLPQQSMLVDSLGPPVEPHRTDIAGSLRMALALMPPDAAKRLVLISDGNENVGLSTQEADCYASLGVPIDVAPVRYEHAAEILVDQLSAPASVKRGSAVKLSLVVRSRTATTARLLLYHNEALVDLDPDPHSASYSLVLDEGPNRFDVPVHLNDAGVHRFHAVVQPDDANTDALPDNNEARAYTIVGEAERVMLVVESRDIDKTDSESAELLRTALADGGVECDVVPIEDLPADGAALGDCSAVILSNVSAFALGPARQQMLASYVCDQGGGLVVVGGDHAFSVGGYAHTPLEEILPVETSRDKLKLLSLSLVIVIDRSGSMRGEKIAMARDAAAGAVRLLSAYDKIGVVAFDSAAQWIVPLQPATQKHAIENRLQCIGSGGGTNMYPALEQARNVLVNVDTNIRHVIILTDGQSQGADFDALARRCGEEDITISAVAVGPDADRNLLTRIAELTGGRMYVAESARPLPQIFASETVIASRAGMYEKGFQPSIRGLLGDSLLSGLLTEELPQLGGHVVTAAKPLANIPLVRVTEDGFDPILANWQAGLGRVVAFTSGMWPKWGPEWTAWSGFSKFWTQTVRYAARPGNMADLEVETTVKGDLASICVTAERLPSRMRGAIAIMGRIISPDFEVTPLRLQRTNVGDYEADFTMNAPGTYLINMPYSIGYGADAHAGVLNTGVSMSYSPEYRALRNDEAALDELAKRTGGRVLDFSRPDAVFEPTCIRSLLARRPIWEDLIRLALLLFLVDVAIRRIAMSPIEEAGRLRRFIHELTGHATPEAATIGGLRAAIAQTRQSDQTHDEAEYNHTNNTSSSPSQTLTPTDQENDDLIQTLKKPHPDQSGPATSKAQSVEEGTYTARLLKAKRRARRQEETD